MRWGTARFAALSAILAVCLCFSSGAHAQAVKYLFEIGGKILTIALEKKADLTVAIVAAAVWDGTKDIYGKAIAAEKKEPPNVACKVQDKNVIDCQGIGRVTLNVQKPLDIPPPSVAPKNKLEPLKPGDIALKFHCGSFTLALLKEGCERGLVTPDLFVTVTPHKKPSPFSTDILAPLDDSKKKSAYIFPGLKQDNVLFRFIPPAEAAVPPKSVETAEISAITYKSGAVYRGQIADGKPNGQGELRQPNGAAIVANFVNGLATGPGTYRTQAGLNVANAHFQGGHLVGLYLCNGTSGDKYAAYAYLMGLQWVAEGWWKLGPGRCVNPIATALPGHDYFLRYEDDKGAAAYADTRRSFCVSSPAFHTVDQILCPAGTQKRGFAQESAANGGLLFELLSGD